MNRVLLKLSKLNPIHKNVRINNILKSSLRFSSFETQPYMLFKLDNGPSTKVSCDKESALKFYNQMTSIRKCQQMAEKMYKEKYIRGFLHLYVGQEAICVGMKAAMKPEDSIITAYRCHGWGYVMGLSIQDILSELTGVTSGCMRGKGGSMHMFAKNFYGGNGIVGAHVPVGAGVAFAQKYSGRDAVCVTLYGDGAANQGQIYEAYNIAKLWDVPCIFICENNLYAMGTAVTRGSANTHFFNRGLNVIPGIKADGMDVLCMRQLMEFSRDYAVKHGPIVLEVVTYRYFGHSMSDPGYSYRKREEIQDVRSSRDAIKNFKENILKAGLVTEAELKAIDDEIVKVVDAAAKKSKEDKEVEEKEVAYDTYAKNLEINIRNNLPWTGYEHKNLFEAVNLK